MPDHFPPVRAVTRGPKFHWFGYYDKLQFDPAGRFLLGMEVDFEHRSPRGDDEIRVGMVDLRHGDEWVELGRTHAWCWQQGCMLQWRPGSQNEVVWNDRQHGRFVCHVLNVETGRRRTLDHPVYAISPDGRLAVGADFRRICHTRPGYGYAGLPDPNRSVLVPPDSGIHLLDLDTGRCSTIITIAQVAAIASDHLEVPGAIHYFNHLLFSPDGSRFVFLHRRFGEGRSGFSTRMLSANPDGSDLYLLHDTGLLSHFIWRDPAHVLAWCSTEAHAGAFHLLEDKTRNADPVGPDVMTRDGHCTYLPVPSGAEGPAPRGADAAGRDWILNDAYPGQDRMREAYLYHVPTGRKVVLGRFSSPGDYEGEWRCDLHPRFSPDGKSVTIDSVHEGPGRQIHLIDISEIV